MNAIKLTDEKQVFRKVMTEFIDCPAEERVINYILRQAKRELIDIFMEEYDDHENFLVQFDLSENISPCELYEITNKQCRRTDGQYIFKGNFTPREECERLIAKKIRVLTMTVTKAIRYN